MLPGLSSIVALIRLLMDVSEKILRRRKTIKGSLGGAFDEPPYGWKKVRDFEYEGVRWAVFVELDPTGFSRLHSVGGADPFHELAFRVSRTASCPKCGVDLEEQKRPWFRKGRYKWSCVGCGFEKLTKVSMTLAADQAARLA